MTNPDLMRLLEALLADSAIAKAYREAPAARQLHHAWLGGLLEHVVSLLSLADRVAAHYPILDRDLLVTGVILHDIGKIRELSWDTGFDYTVEGVLLGHIQMGIDLVEKTIASLPGFPDRLRTLVLHMILSHHGKLEFGSPKLPMIPEALVLTAGDHRTVGRRAYHVEQVEVRAAQRAIAVHVRNDVASTPVGVEPGQYVGQLAALPGPTARIAWCRGTSGPTASFRPFRAITDRTQSGCSRAAVPMLLPGRSRWRATRQGRRLIPEASSGEVLTHVSSRRLDLDLGGSRRLVATVMSMRSEHVDQNEHRRVRQTLAAIGQGAAAL